jgi:RimJ/RimL family protein N-acetyltransferase
MIEVFGSPDQNRMQIKGEHLARLLSNDPRYCSHGRGVQIIDYDPQAADLVESLARLIGASACEMVPKDRCENFQKELEDRGLRTDVIGHFIGDINAIEMARAALVTRPLPEDLSVRMIDARSPSELVQAFAEVSMLNGVLPPIGSVMRGISRPGFGMVAMDGNGRPVATAGAVESRHPDHPMADMVQWGQLATVPDRQGQGIARALGALAILEAASRLGARHFRTGINPSNIASARLCASLGVCDSDYVIVAAMNPDAFTDERITK